MCYCHYCFANRGDSFRAEFSNLGDIASLLPSIHTIALTATATISTQKAVCRSLGMKKPVIISESPNKINIIYKVTPNVKDVEDAFEPVVNEILRHRKAMDRVVIFCRSYDDSTLTSLEASWEKTYLNPQASSTYQKCD